MKTKTYLNEFENRFELKIYVQPGATKTEISGIHGGRLKIRLHAPPVDGKANETLISFLSEYFGIAKSKIEIIRGQKSREKDIMVHTPWNLNYEI
jgi:uncharacterized protein